MDGQLFGEFGWGHSAAPPRGEVGLVACVAFAVGATGGRQTLVGLGPVLAGTVGYGLRGRHPPQHHRLLVEHLARGETSAGRARRRPAPRRR
ncbi:MAG TPA: hypothetical protein VFA46_17860 [Actinomycetes bacterium]|nr:hypothetical protein [Actinomycetes bacterium]